tara:strand:+ start:296 stop:505 length:210 start_codon:yes stop_codon:yes gene_type:complete
MLRNIRVGDKVYMTYHMSNKGIVTEIFFKTVQAGNGSGPFSQQMFVKFISELTGKEVTIKRQDIRRSDD